MATVIVEQGVVGHVVEGAFVAERDSVINP
jgi:hypothetical protein